MSWDESKHPRDSIGRFISTAISSYSNDTESVIIEPSEKLEGEFQRKSQARRIYDAVKSNESDSEDVYIDVFSNYPTIRLSPSERKMVTHELATNLTKEEQKQRIVIRHIRNYTYTVVNLGFGNYRVIGKHPIKARRPRR